MFWEDGFVVGDVPVVSLPRQYFVNNDSTPCAVFSSQFSFKKWDEPKLKSQKMRGVEFNREQLDIQPILFIFIIKTLVGVSSLYFHTFFISERFFLIEKLAYNFEAMRSYSPALPDPVVEARNGFNMTKMVIFWTPYNGHQQIFI